MAEPFTDPLPGLVPGYYRLGVSSTQSIAWERSPQMGGTMFAITSTRIVGLIAVVCAVVVAPQALAVPITDSNTAVRRSSPRMQPGYDLSGFDLNPVTRAMSSRGMS